MFPRSTLTLHPSRLMATKIYNNLPYFIIKMTQMLKYLKYLKDLIMKKKFYNINKFLVEIL